MDDEQTTTPTPLEIKLLTLEFERDMLTKVAEALYSYIDKVSCYSIGTKHLGIPTEAFMISTGLFCFKPRVLVYSPTRVKMDEYSSISRESIPITRPAGVIASYINHLGNKVVRDLDGVEARYFQHELDVMHNIDWRTRATQVARLNAAKRVLH